MMAERKHKKKPFDDDNGLISPACIWGDTSLSFLYFFCSSFLLRLVCVCVCALCLVLLCNLDFGPWSVPKPLIKLSCSICFELRPPHLE